MFQWRTGEPPIRIIEKSTKVWGNVIEVIEDAREELVLVSPYNEYSIPLDEALKKAAEKGIPITAVCREEQKNKEDAHFKWLMSIGADVYLCRRLHAKIYYNESTAIVTSMNLLKSSATDSKEFGFVIKDATLREEIRNYVRTELLSHSKQVAPRQPTAPKPPAARRPKAEPRQSLDRGFCIRCREGIPYNSEHPLCSKDFRTWNKYQDSDYPEKHCHRCGKERKTSFAKPLCAPCYKEAASAK